MSDSREAGDDGRGLVLFVHGSWIHADGWIERADLFDRSGYDCLLLRWPQEPRTAGERADPCRLTTVGLTELIDHVLSAVAAMDRAPILLGHGAGGLVAHTLLSRVPLAAVVALAPAASGWRSLTSEVRSRQRVTERTLLRRAAALPSCDEFLCSYTGAQSRSEAMRLYERWVTPAHAHGRLPRSVGCATPASRPPTLLVSGGRDRVSTETDVEALRRRSRRTFPDAACDHQVFPDRGHSMAIDSRWRDIAYFCLDWLTRQDL